MPGHSGQTDTKLYWSKMALSHSAGVTEAGKHRDNLVLGYLVLGRQVRLLAAQLPPLQYSRPPFFKQGTFQPQTPTCVELHLSLNDLSCSAPNNHQIQFLFKHVPNVPIGRTARPIQLELVWGAYLVRQNCVLRLGTFREQALIYQFMHMHNWAHT